MTPAARTLAEFAARLRYEDIPAHVVERAKACIIDTVAACTHGAVLPWSRIVVDFVRLTGAQGDSSVMGTGHRLQPPAAVLANGALAHAFELDPPTHPSVGVHPGPGNAVPGIAVAQSLGSSGKDLITAFVAGFEVMHRIADTAPQSCEKLGFHAPGLFGVFGSTVTAGRLMGLDAERMTHALGVAGSLCSGVLEFSKSGGGMVKRLHPGRAAEGGVMAAMLASGGYTGPAGILDGHYGFLNVYLRNPDRARLTAALGETWQTMTIAHKRYACHGTAQVPVTAALALREEEGVRGDDIESIVVAGSEKIVSHHDIREPGEIATAQYSVPFCVALAFYLDPRDPAVFSEASVADARIRALTRKVKVELLDPIPADQPKATRLTVVLKDGRRLEREMSTYPGMPEQPLAREALWSKFELLTAAALPRDRGRALFESLARLEDIGDVRTVRFF